MNGINADWIYVVPSIKSISVDDHSSVLLLSQDYHIIYHPIILWIFFHYTAFLLINADHNMTKSDWESKFYCSQDQVLPSYFDFSTKSHDLSPIPPLKYFPLCRFPSKKNVDHNDPYLSVNWGIGLEVESSIRVRFKVLPRSFRPISNLLFPLPKFIKCFFFIIFKVFWNVWLFLSFFQRHKI